MHTLKIRIVAIAVVSAGLSGGVLAQTASDTGGGRVTISQSGGAIDNAASTSKKAGERPAGKYTGELISLNFSSVELAKLFAIFADVSKYRLSFDPAANATVAVQYFDTPWDQAMYDIAARHHLAVKIQNGTIYVRKR